MGYEACYPIPLTGNANSLVSCSHSVTIDTPRSLCILLYEDQVTRDAASGLLKFGWFLSICLEESQKQGQTPPSPPLPSPFSPQTFLLLLPLLHLSDLKPRKACNYLLSLSQDLRKGNPDICWWPHCLAKKTWPAVVSSSTEMQCCCVSSLTELLLYF